MSRDPYHDFASDLEKSLSSAKSISRRYLSLRSSSSSSQALLTTKDELLDSIEGLKQDVQDVKQSVNVVEKAGPERFGVGWDELQRRKSFVDQCENDIEVSETLSKDLDWVEVSRRRKFRDSGR